MSEHLKLARLKIEAACKMKPTDEHAVKLEEMLYCLLLHLEAQQETLASGLTLHESAGASPETGTTSTPATGTTGPTSSRLGLGRAWEESGSLLTRNLPSRTTEPTSSTPSTDRSTGLSVHAIDAMVLKELREKLERGVCEEENDLDRGYNLGIRTVKEWIRRLYIEAAQGIPDSPASSWKLKNPGSDGQYLPTETVARACTCHPLFVDYNALTSPSTIAQKEMASE